MSAYCKEGVSPISRRTPTRPPRAWAWRSGRRWGCRHSRRRSLDSRRLKRQSLLSRCSRCSRRDRRSRHSRHSSRNGRPQTRQTRRRRLRLLLLQSSQHQLPRRFRRKRSVVVTNLARLFHRMKISTYIYVQYIFLYMYIYDFFSTPPQMICIAFQLSVSIFFLVLGFGTCRSLNCTEVFPRCTTVYCTVLHTMP